MKKILLLVFVATYTFVSCSEEDASTPNENIPAQLQQTVETIYDIYQLPNEEPDTTYTQVMKTHFEGGKPIKMDIYTGNDNYYNSYETYSYNTDGLISQKIRHINATNEDYLTVFTYDLAGRISQVTDTTPAGLYSTNTYTYNNDGTITQTGEYFTWDIIETTIFHVNEDGLIFKEEFEDRVITYTFNAFNTMSMDAQWALGSSSITYTYDTVHDPSLLGLQHPAGALRTNRRFFNDYWYNVSESSEVISDNYLTQQNRGGYDIINISYTFNDAGQPLIQLKEFNSSSFIKTDYIYE